MIKYFAEQNVKEYELMLEKWHVLKEIKRLLKIPYQATIDLQLRELTLSDLYGIWTKMELHLKEYCAQKTISETGLPKLLYNAITNRREKLFNNPFMSSALYLDPRYHREVRKAPMLFAETKEMLLNLWNRIQSKDTSIDNVQVNTSAESNGSIDFQFDAELALDKYLSGENHQSNSQCTDGVVDIEHLIELFQPDPLLSKESVLKYWKMAKNVHPEIYKLAAIVFAIPPTEVQIERDFSKLDYVFNDRRCSLIQERLEDIMLLNLNPALFFQVKSDEMAELKKYQAPEKSE